MKLLILGRFWVKKAFNLNFMKRICVIVLVFLMTIIGIYAQKTSFTIGPGTVWYLGDMQQTLQDVRPALAFHYKINLYKNYNVRIGLFHGYYGADDANTAANKNRSLRFTSPLTEGNIQFVYDFISQSQDRNGREWVSRFPFTPYVYVGVGGVFFNPRVEKEGGWLDLQPLGTEGQYIMRGDGYPKPYKLFQLIVPGGIGFQYRFNRHWGAGFDAGYRYTLTDYLDDVSGYYPNMEELRSFSGIAAVQQSDPKLLHEEGMLRGNPKNKDSYILASFSLSYYFIKKSCPTP